MCNEISQTVKQSKPFLPFSLVFLSQWWKMTNAIYYRKFYLDSVSLKHVPTNSALHHLKRIMCDFFSHEELFVSCYQEWQCTLPHIELLSVEQNRGFQFVCCLVSLYCINQKFLCVHLEYNKEHKMRHVKIFLETFNYSLCIAIQLTY